MAAAAFFHLHQSVGNFESYRRIGCLGGLTKGEAHLNAAKKLAPLNPQFNAIEAKLEELKTRIDSAKLAEIEEIREELHRLVGPYKHEQRWHDEFQNCGKK